MQPGIKRVPSLRSWLHLVANESRFLDQSFPGKGASKMSQLVSELSKELVQALFLCKFLFYRFGA